MAGTKTDNAFLYDKARLRADHIPGGNISVLDVFGGTDWCGELLKK